jgi:hypothetical protein
MGRLTGAVHGDAGSKENSSMCAHFVPEDVAFGDLSDSADFRISKLRIPNTGLGSPPSRHHS